MGATYTRQSSSTIVDGATIEAAHFNDEFDQLVTAFAVDTGHSHDGTAAEGGDVTKLLGTAITIGDGTAGTDIAVTFDGESNDGVLTWMEDEDYFKFSDDILINSTEKLMFQDTGTYIYSNADGDLDLVSDGTNADAINLASAGGVTVDAAVDIVLDAGGGDVFFKDDGTTFGSATNTSGNLIIKSGTTTALTFSGANATLAGDLTISGDDLTMGTNTDTAVLVADGTNFNPVVPSGDVTLTNAGVFGIASGVIVNADVNASAAIVDTKLATISTANKVGLAALDIDGGTDIGEAIVDADLLIIDNGAGGTNRKTAASRLKTYIGASDLTSIGSNLVPDGSGTRDIGTTSAEWNDLYLADTSIIYFGSSQDITLTHVADVGLTLTHVATADNKPIVFQLKSEEDAIIADEVIASIEFAAGDSDGTDGATVAAGIHAIAEGTFAADANATKLVFTTGVSETAAASATAKMILSSAGNLTLTGAIELGHASDTTIARSGSGDVTIEGNAVYRAGGTDVPVADGGTGASSLTDGGVLLGSGTGAVTAMAVLSDGQMIVGDGTTDPVPESGATLRTSIGLGTFAVEDVNAVPALTLAAAITGADQTVSAINLKDYGEVTNAIGATGGGTQDIDLTLGNNVVATVDTGANTFTFSNPTATDELCGFTLFLTNGGSQTVNWPGTVDFAGGTAPTLTTSGLDILVFITTDGGSIWHGMVGSADSK
jgi:hypothetical protein